MTANSATEARVAVTDLILRYAELLDEGRFGEVADLFAHATFRAVVGKETYTHRGRDEVLARFEQLVMTYDGVPATKHVTTNVIVDTHDDRTAEARSYFTVHQRGPDFPLQVVIAGRYHDRFECVEGSWRFTDRLVLSDLVGDLSRHVRASPY
jgi:3-phenylpropionate/cinnamic acid dioxygenase small subunit